MARMTNAQLVAENTRLREHCNHLETKIASMEVEVAEAKSFVAACAPLRDFVEPESYVPGIDTPLRDFAAACALLRDFVAACAPLRAKRQGTARQPRCVRTWTRQSDGVLMGKFEIGFNTFAIREVQQ